MHRHDRFEEGDDKNHGAGGKTQVYEEEIATLLEKNDDLIKKLGIFMGDPAPGGDDDDSTCPENYIIIDDTDSDPDDSDDEFEDEAGADIMESSTDQNF